MILGVALVVNELNKGQRMIFRYPESIPTFIANSTDKGLIKLYNQYFGFSLENLAKLFRPKNALLSKVLEISIDDLNFISYPCPCQGLSYDDMNLSNIPANEAGALNGGGALGVLGSPMGLPASQNGSCNSGEVITMFNVIITSVSCKAMRKINPDFAFKCQYKFASTPGADPIASALGLRAQSYGICRETIRRLVETVAASLLQQERSCRYVTEQVTLMLRIMDNWNISKQLDASANSSGNVVMESGVTAALSIHMDNGGYDSAAASLHANSKYHVPAHSVEGSLKSTPRSSRSNSNAPPPAVECGTLVPPSATALHPAAATARITTTVTTSVAAATAGGGGGGAPPGGGSAVEVPVTVTTGIGGTPRVVTRANGNLHIGGGGGGSSSSADNSDSRMHEVGIAETLSIDTEFCENVGNNSSAARTALLSSDSGEGASSSVFPSLEVPATGTGTLGSPGSSVTATPATTASDSTAQGTVQAVAPASEPTSAPASASGAVAAELSVGRVSPTPPPGAAAPLTSSAHHQAHGLTSFGSEKSMYVASFGAGNPATPLTQSRASSGLGTGLGGGSSRTGSGLSTTPSKGASSGLGVGLNVLGGGDGSLGTAGGGGGGGGGGGVDMDGRSTEWGVHLMTDFIALSNLANELRVLYHNIIGGHSVNVSFNGVKSVNVPLFCNDRHLCEDCAHLKTMNSMAHGVEALDNRQHHSSTTGATVGALSSSVTISISGAGAGAGRIRQITSPYGRPSPAGQLTSALNYPHSARKSAKESAKMKGFNLNTQTLLTIADTDTIMNILQSLDSCNFSLVANLSETSLNAFGSGGGGGGDGDSSSSGDLQGLKHLQQQRISTRLVAILEAADPTQSFLDLSLALDEPVEELLTTANYLRSWGLAEVIPVIYSRSCFRVHSKAVLNRDSRVGRAFEALLLNLDVQNYERSLSRSETVERLSSENFLPGVSGGDVFYESTPKDTSPEVKRRAFSMTSNDGGSHDSLGQFAASHAAYHSFTGPPAGAVHVHNNNSAHHIAPASAHYLVSPEVSKYRQRRELRERERDDPKQQLHYSMPNSRSSEHNFNNSLATSHSLPDAPHKQTSQPLPPVSSAAAADSKPSNKAYLTNKEVTPKRSHSLTGDGTSTYVGSVSASSGSSAGRVSEAPTLSGYGNNGSGGDQASGRERVHSFSATEKREQHPSAAEPSSAWSLVSAIFGHAATHASQVRKQRGSYNGSASTSAAEAMPGMGYNKSSTAGAELVNSRSRPQQVARGNRGDDDRESIGTREVVQTQAASSYPPSALLGKLDVSSANREHGFNHVVSLAEVGGVSAPLTIAQVLGTGSSSATIDDAMYNLSGRSNYYNQQGEGTPRCDDSAPPVHCLDVADNLPPQYSLPALLSAFNGARPLQEVLEMWPEPLREYSVEIVVFLLRWHEIVPVDSYIVNLLHLTDPRNASAAELPSPLSVSGTIFPASSSSSAAGASAKHKAMHTPTATHSSARVNFALGTARGESAYSTSPTMTYSGGGAGGFSESKSYLSPLEEAILSLREQLPHSLSAHEVAIMEKVFPFVANMPMSSKTLGEIVWMVRMSEEELVQVVEKVPYLKIVKKLSV